MKKIILATFTIATLFSIFIKPAYAQVCAQDQYQGRFTFCSISALDRKIAPGYSGCRNGEFCIVNVGDEHCGITVEPSWNATDKKYRIDTLINTSSLNEERKYSLQINRWGEVGNELVKDGSGRDVTFTNIGSGQDFQLAFDVEDHGTLNSVNLRGVTLHVVNTAGARKSICEVSVELNHDLLPPNDTRLPAKPYVNTLEQLQGDCPKDNLSTAIGCIPISSSNDLIAFFLRWAVGIGGGIAFLLIVYAGFTIMTSSGNPERLKGGQELLTSAIAGLIMIIFSIFILRLIGINILQIPGFGA